MMRSHSMAWLLFILFDKNMIFRKDLKPFIFILFLKGKQNKKENPYLEKNNLWKTKPEFGGQVTY